MSDLDGEVPSLLVLFGPPAVGKTTVGQEIERFTGFRLFHIHQVIDLVTQYFPYIRSADSPYYRLVVSYRRQFFEEAARSGMKIVSTGGWRFPPAGVDANAVRSYAKPFLDHGGRVYLVQLLASLETRLARNRTEHRRRLKRAEWSTDEYLRRDTERGRYDSDGAVPLDAPFLRLETDELSTSETAEQICAYFGLPQLHP